MKVLMTGAEQRVPIKSWCAEPEQGCIDQANNLAALPFAFKHVALMPDTHQGYGMPIGGVLAAKGLEEAASAYKDIDTVMAEQADLVQIVTKLTPMGVIKG